MTNEAGPISGNSGARPSETIRADIEAVLADTTLPVGERQARLQALAAELGIEVDPAGEAAGEPDPMRIQLFNALGLVAQGGHDYAGAEDGVAVDPKTDTRTDR